jgi:hypothetical protein
MPDTSLSRIRIGEIYFQWDSKDRHYLAVDLSGPLPEWVVEADGELVLWRSIWGCTRAVGKRCVSISAVDSDPINREYRGGLHGDRRYSAVRP